MSGPVKRYSPENGDWQNGGFPHREEDDFGEWVTYADYQREHEARLAAEETVGKGTALLIAAREANAQLYGQLAAAEERAQRDVPDAMSYAIQHNLAVTEEWMDGWNACLTLLVAAQNNAEQPTNSLTHENGFAGGMMEDAEGRN